MGWFSPNQKTIKYKELEKILKRISVLNSVERAYVHGLFQQYESGGITKKEVQEAVRDMIKDTGDGIDPAEAKRVQSELLSHLEG